MQLNNLSQTRISVVAIPAHNEATYIVDCLAALAVQRDETGAPLDPGSLEILIFANNCTDQTASIARELSRTIPYPVREVELGAR
jgi:glycosyltransferase involved in cell wall biosynthesis